MKLKPIVCIIVPLSLMLFFSGPLLSTQKEAKTVFSSNGSKPVPFQQIPKGLTSLSAQACNACHSEIYVEWRDSTRAIAWTNPEYQEILQREGNPLECIYCHTPLENQQPFLLIDGTSEPTSKPIMRENSTYEPTLQNEGVTCAVCHIRDGNIITTNNPSSNAPHPVVKNGIMETPELCAFCHQLNLSKPGHPRFFYNTFNEWSESEYKRKNITCQNCHMPEIFGVPSLNEAKSYRAHHFMGSRLDPMLQRALTTEVKLSKPLYAIGDKMNITVTLTNSGAGHMFPTGDPFHFAVLTIGIANQDGDIIEKLEFAIARKVNPDPPFNDLSDTRLKPLETRAFPFDTTLSSKNKNDRLFLIVQLEYFRMPTDMAEQMNIPPEAIGKIFDTQIIPLTE